MAFCSKCGLKLEEGDLFCPKCGAKARILEETAGQEPSKAPVEEVKEPVQEASVPVTISKGEAIRRLERYRKNLVNQKQLREKKTSLASRADSRERPMLSESAPFIKFYWKFILAGTLIILAGYILMIISALKGGDFEAVLFIWGGIIGGLITILVGIGAAKRSQRAAVYVIKEHNGKIRRSQQSAEELSKVSGELSRVDKLVREDCEMVPMNYRTADKISKLIMVFKGPDVNTIEEAIAKLENKK